MPLAAVAEVWEEETWVSLGLGFETKTVRAREAVGSWGTAASPHYTEIGEAGCPRKRLKNEFFWA